jgi:hypothetical protein
VEKKIQFADSGADGPIQTIKEQDGKWWWADEIFEWHGPCSTRGSAQKRQSLYVGYLQGELNFVTPNDWRDRKDRENPDTIHPCNTAAPWDCDCAGSCSCHWEIDP